MHKLSNARAGIDLTLISVEGNRNSLMKLADMGLIPGHKLRVLNNSKHGPIMLLIKGTKIVLGHSLAAKVLVKEERNMKNKKITIALAGNPNAGKSTIFNNLTGMRQHVSNYPGVTVEKKEGNISFENYKINIVDLPGTYSLSAYSEDEIVARDFIIKNKPDVIVHVVDSSNLERNLYIATQLMELEVPLVLAMNMSDISEKKGQKVDYVQLSKFFGVAIVPTVGTKNIGMKNLLETVVKVYEKTIKTQVIHVDYGAEISEEFEKLNQIIKKDKTLTKQYPKRWLIIKILEKDFSVLDIVKKSSVAKETLKQNKKSRRHIQAHFGDAAETIIADRRYGFISGACAKAVKLSVEQRHNLSDKIDKVILNKILGIPIFIAVMYSIFKFTFTFSEPAVGLFEHAFEWLSNLTKTYVPDGLFQSFIVDGIIAGVGGVLGFLPLVLFMFFAIAFFEDSGYMARAAFVMDKLMSKFGLHGKSFLPMMISTNGCAVPGIIATRTLESKKDRLVTMMVTPFMICGAKLPIFALFIGTFFLPEQGANIMFAMYILSVMIALSSAWILKKFVFKGEATHFVMELPPYRLPTLKGLLLKMWERGWLYIRKAGTIIVLISIIIWAGFTFPTNINLKKDNMNEKEIAIAKLEQSYAGRAGKAIEPILKPIGLDGRSGVALIAGLAAKEVVVTTLGTIYSLGNINPKESESLRDKMKKDSSWTPLKAISFLMFCLIYLPCIAVMAVFYKESGSKTKWLLFLIFWTTILAWSTSFVVYQGGRLLGLGG